MTDIFDCDVTACMCIVQLTLFSVLLEGLEQTDLAHLAHLSGGLGRGHPLVTAQVAEQIFRNLFQETIFLFFLNDVLIELHGSADQNILYSI